MKAEQCKTDSLEAYDKVSVSARVNSYVVDQYKKSEIPLSLVIEASLINFMRLEDNEKIKFISNNLPDKVKTTDMKVPKMEWKRLLEAYFKKLSIPETVSSSLMTGVCIGAVALIGGIISALGDKIFDER